MDTVDLQIQGELCKQELLQTRLAALHMKNNKRGAQPSNEREIRVLERELSACCTLLRQLYEQRKREQEGQA